MNIYGWLAITAIVLYSTHHWIGATFSLAFLIFNAIGEDRGGWV